MSGPLVKIFFEKKTRFATKPARMSNFLALYNGVTNVLQGLKGGNTMMVRGVKGVLQACNRGVTGVIHGFYTQL